MTVPGISPIVMAMLWQTALLPLLAALAVLAVCRVAGLRTQSALLAVAGGVLASYAAAQHAQWSPVPKVALDWLPWIVVVGAIVTPRVEGIAQALTRRGSRLVVSLVVGWLVVWPALNSFGIAKALAGAAVTGVLIALAWSARAHSAPGRQLEPLFLAVVAGGAGLAMLLDSSQSTGILGGALAAALGACMLFCLPRMGGVFSAAAAGLSMLVLGTLLAIAHFYAGFPLTYVALLTAALWVEPLLAAVVLARERPVTSAWQWAGAALTVLPVLATVALAVKAMRDSGAY
jgi:hypothetical protein